MSSRVLGRNGVPSVMLNENTCLAGVGWLKRHVELGALLRGEAGLAPREDELLRWGPGTDDADNERRAVLVRLDEPAALATLESKSAAATFAELEETVRLPPLADLRREASKRLGWFARDPGCHQDSARDQCSLVIANVRREGVELHRPCSFGVAQPSGQIPEGLLAQLVDADSSIKRRLGVDDETPGAKNSQVLAHCGWCHAEHVGQFAGTVWTQRKQLNGPPTYRVGECRQNDVEGGRRSPGTHAQVGAVIG